MERDGLDDLAALLPEDVLADVLRRVATPRELAVSRSVCKAWRAIVDGEGLLHTELPFTGIFLYLDALPFPEFFSRPPSPCRPAISGNLDFLPRADEVHNISDSYCIQDHCNGLLLVSVSPATPGTDSSYVVNPATRRWDTLPPFPPDHPTAILRRVWYHHYLAFDPTASPHYQVFRIPYLFHPLTPEDEYDPLEGASEWPPSLHKLVVFSSRTRRWEDRSSVREGDALVTIAKMREDSSTSRLSSVYWRGSLYVHCQTNFVMRISLSEDKYKVIRPPTNMGVRPYLGRSENGVYFASFVYSHIRIFNLNESCGQTEWIFKHDYDLNKPEEDFGKQVQGPWILEDINYDIFDSSLGGISKEEVVQEAFQWNSDSDDFDGNRDVVEAHPTRCGHIDILGFHPYKEILFFCSSSTYQRFATGFAYNLRSFKVERLGSIYPEDYCYFDDSGQGDERWDIECFPYTPCCWIEEFPEKEN